MFSAATYTARRRCLAELVGEGLILLPGNAEAPMNCRANTYPFRQDSSFRYFAGHARPGLVLTIDAATGESRLYGEDLTLDDIVWMGEQPSVAELAERVGAVAGAGPDRLGEQIGKYNSIHYLPPYRESRRRQLREWVGHDNRPSETLIRAVVELRSVKTAEEIAELDRASATSRRMHQAAAERAQPGITEAEIAGLIEGIAVSAGGRLAYAAIVTRNGHILHNHDHGNELRAGDLLLIDAGAETDTGYAGDLTRTFAIGQEMTPQQQEIYDIVALAKRSVEEAIRPGIPYRSLHDRSAEVIARGLKELGLMRGNPAEAVAAGAHALFFPHGLGHMIGMDVHDMEDLGEDYVGYDEEIKRSEQFGTAYLRLGRRLREDFCLTVEPGVYFIPALIDKWRAEGKYADFVDYAAVEKYRDFGGIRLEDDVVVTGDNCRILGVVEE